MGTTLTGTTPQDTYDSLIKVTDNGPLSGSLKKLTDGLGNDSALSLSTSAASITGTLAVSGNATFDTSTLVVDAANNRVGVGTATPDNALEVAGAAGTTTSLVKLTNSSAAAPSNIAQVGFELANSFSGANTDIVFGAIKANSGNYDSDFYISTSSGTSSPAERMRITAAGNVGIGTSSAESKLHVAGSASGSDVTLYIDNVASSALNNSSRLKFSSDTGSSVSGGGAELNCINVDAGNGAVDLFVKSWTGGAYTEKARFLAGGGLTFNGDTAAANALDDYEEGTFTPTFAPTSGAYATLTYGTTNGKYTKIGNRVDFTLRVTITAYSAGTASGILRLEGLPFACVASYVGSLSFSLVEDFAANRYPIKGFVNDTTSYILLRYMTALNTDEDYVSATDITATSSLRISGTYFTA